MDAQRTVWPGHRAGTREVLESILVRAANNDKGITLAERFLVNACELRCELQGGGWHTRVQVDSVAKLQLARVLLLALGADSLADSLASTIAALNAGVSPQSKTAYLRHAERQLVGAGSLLDQLLETFARKVGSGTPVQLPELEPV